MTWRELRSGTDRVLSNADKSTAQQAIAELIWNALDAEATHVSVAVETNELGAPVKVVVVDDGRGIPAEDSADLFLTEGDSWKKAARFSPSLRRPMHGQLGRGRLLAYAIADEVEWATVAAASGGEHLSFTIRGTRARAAGFDISDPEVTDVATGTRVTLRMRESQKAAQVADDGFVLKVLELMAESLSSLPDVEVLWLGQRLTPEELIERRESLEVPEAAAIDLHGHAPPELIVVEWSARVGAQTIHLCDDGGATLSDFKPASMTPTPFSWSAYLRWSGFRDPELMGVADLHAPEFKHSELLGAASAALSAYLGQRLQSERGSIVRAWIDEGVYPYKEPPQSFTETVERELFDIVAVIASSSVPKRGTDQKRLTLRLLREALTTEPTRLRRVLEAVVELSADDLDSLERLLERTELGSVVRAAHRVTDRLDFIDGLAALLYSDETRRMFREVDQLHPMLVREPWVFGDEWDVALSEHGLTRVVASAVARHNPDAVVAVEPVTLPDGKRGRVDLVFHKIVPESEQQRHLVVELKRPGELTMSHYAQLAGYATAITQHPEVLNSATKWDFWLVGTDLDRTLANERAFDGQPGLVKDYGTHRLWVIRWGELLDGLRRKFESYRAELGVTPTTATGLTYLHRVHAEYVPDGTPGAQTEHE